MSVIAKQIDVLIGSGRFLNPSVQHLYERFFFVRDVERVIISEPVSEFDQIRRVVVIRARCIHTKFQGFVGENGANLFLIKVFVKPNDIFLPKAAGLLGFAVSVYREGVLAS